MSPNGAPAAAAVYYGIVKGPKAIESIKKLSSSLRDDVNNAIDELQINPRPVKHTLIGGTELGMVGPALLSLAVSGGYSLIYQVDDTNQRVYIAAVTRFS
jgi:mRNA-degrading endonuclease RelE of RelBE toxin-antitoxin system